jgi:hypothetical protein
VRLFHVAVSDVDVTFLVVNPDGAWYCLTDGGLTVVVCVGAGVGDGCVPPTGGAGSVLLTVTLGAAGGVSWLYVWLMNCGTRLESTPPGVLLLPTAVVVDAVLVPAELVALLFL